MIWRMRKHDNLTDLKNKARLLKKPLKYTSGQLEAGSSEDGVKMENLELSKEGLEKDP